MKKILNVIFAFGTLLAVTGCSNAISLNNSTELDKDYSAKTQVEASIADGKDVANVFNISDTDITTIEATTYSKSADSVTKITIPFTLNVDAESAADAFKIYSIDVTATTEKVYKQETTVKIDNVEVYKNKVSLFAKLKDIDAIEIDINPTVLKATNGQKLDADGDFSQGEETDDSYVIYLCSSAQGTLPAGPVKKNPRNRIGISNDGFDFANKTWSCDVDLTDDDPKTVFGSSVKIQSCVAGGTWTDVTAVPSSVNNGSDYTFTLTWTADIKNALFRVVADNPNEIVTTNEYAGYKRKLSLNARETLKVVTAAKGYAPVENQAPSQDFFSFIVYNMDSNNWIKSITFTVNKDYPNAKGIADISKIHLFDSSLTEVTLPEFETLYNVGTGASFNNVITMVFSSPVYVGDVIYLYADPELSIRIDESGTVKDYKIGYDAADMLNPNTKGYVYLYGKEVPIFNQIIRDYKDGQLVNIPSGTDRTPTWQLDIPLIPGKKVKFTIYQTVNDVYFDAVFWLYKDGDTSSNLFNNGSSYNDSDINGQTYTEAGMYQLRIGPYYTNRTGNVWVKIEEVQ